MEYVEQRTDSDCGVACAAMLTGTTYEEAWEVFDEDIGYAHWASIEQYLNKHSLTMSNFRKSMRSYCKGYLVIVKSKFWDGSHWMVMDTSGKIYNPDPDNKPEEYHNMQLFPVRELLE